MAKSNRIYQLKITLKDIAPPIWRRILVPENFTFAQLHEVIQIAMGWTGYHLHEFWIQQYPLNASIYIGVPDKEYAEEREIIDERKERIDKWFGAVCKQMTYIYDFGDSWEHTVLLEKVLPMDDEIKYPVCAAGKRACPPEDCGSIGGYYDLIEIMKNPKHKEYKDMLEWLGGVPFDSEEFYLESVNEEVEAEFRDKR